MSIHIRLRFEEPRYLAAMLDFLGMAIDEANDCIADDKRADLEDPLILGNIRDAIWLGMEAEGFSKGHQGELLYKGLPVFNPNRSHVQALDMRGIPIKPKEDK